MRKRKILAGILAATMMASALAGCGGGGEETKTPLAGFNGEGYPIVKDGYTLSVMAKYNAARSGAIEENTAFQEMEKITNVKMDINAVDESSFSEKLSVTLAGDDLPDVFLGCTLNRTVQQQQIKLGTIIDLKPYIDKYAPNVKKLLEESEEFKNIVTLPTGEIATLPYFQINLENKKCPPEIMMVYKPWLDKLGLNMPETTEDFYNVLKAFKEQDPNGNGQQDEIPFCPKNLSDFYAIFGLFGIMAEPSYNYIFKDGDTAEFAPIQPEFKEALAYYHKLYAEGLMDKDVFVQNEQQVLAKGTSEDAVIGSTVSSAGFAVVGNERGADMVPTPVMSKPGAEEKMWISRELATMGNFAVTKACEYPEVAVRWIDYLYSDEGAKLAWMGVEGVSYEWAEDGTWNWISKDGQSATEVRAKNTLVSGMQCASAFPIEWFDLNDGVESAINEQRVWMTENYGQYLRTPAPPVYLDPNDEKEIASIAADVNQYVNQYIAQVVTGELDLDSSWTEFEATCKKMNIDRMVEIYQNTYDNLK